MNIVILSGGWSESYASIKSAKVVQSLFANEKITCLDPVNGLNKLKSNILKINPKIIINLVHGYWGEDGYAQLFLDDLKIPYSGPKMNDAFLSMNKHMMRVICTEINIPIPQGNTYTNSQYQNTVDFYPHLTKPIFGGSSHGIKVINCEEEKTLNNSQEPTLLCEKLIVGPELGIAVLNGKVLGGVIIEHEEQIYTVNAKNTDDRVTFNDAKLFPDQALVEEAKTLAVKLYKRINGHGIARIDFKLSDKPYFIDYNSIPGMVLLPKILKYGGYSDEDFRNMLLGIS